MTATLARLRARWRYVVAALAVVAAYLLGRRRSQPDGRALGRAEGRAREVADSLHGEAAELRGEVERAHERDAAADAERAERVEAATRAVPEVPPPGWRDPPSFE
jgi:hypothetical protein